jgi:hypothetical protein
MPIPDRRSNTGTYPACQTEHVELGLLHEYRSQHERDDRPHRRPNDPIKAFGEHHAAERLHQHEHSRHGGAGLLQVQQHGNAQREQRGGHRFEQMKPDEAVARCPVPAGRSRRAQYRGPLPMRAGCWLDQMLAFHESKTAPRAVIRTGKSAERGNARARLARDRF